MPDYGPCFWCDATGLLDDGETCWGCNGTAVVPMDPDMQDEE